jgi:hypothetical protein
VSFKKERCRFRVSLSMINPPAEKKYLLASKPGARG